MEIWLLVSITLLFLMVVGIALVYCGSVRFKNALTCLCFPFLLLPLTYVVWRLLGERIIFSAMENPFVVPLLKYSEAVASGPYFLFQYLFCFISVLVLWGSTLERVTMKFYGVFTFLWLLLVYCPVSRWLLNKEGWLREFGVIDFAGGFTVHVTSGFSALILANCIGRRVDYFQLRNKFSQPLIFFGSFLIWIGWFGFNAGSSIAFNDSTVVAFENTFVAGLVSLGVWCLIDYIHTPNRVTLTGISLGLVSGLVAITPAAGLVDVNDSIFIGLLSGVFCNYASRYMHKVFKVDDTVDVFPTHGIGGVVGALATGYLVLKGGANSYFYPNLVACLVVAFYSMTVTWVLVKLLRLVMEARVSRKDEEDGSDIRIFGENIVNLR
ncbi:MAG: hypothetical protein CME67_00205 [Halobacteriovoraceae bacterium]|nr:hypothetical protein [Halobacteriovoraceae bacterium]|tara:strand:- start:145 stop:1287 length:1143 start_codon:yes stop_codon:yes gene_type:complete